MSYLALARKWRPHDFSAVQGQSHVVRALSNALTTQRLHHAYLFAGTRGVGKTTLARILAKCLNCETGITATPCQTCQACLAIDKGHFVDLIEVDAASRTRVEDTRELLENVQYLPTLGRFKIYIIDEVHMLSNHSFNALLKTLEEPPEHVKFLLATTDPQKLPVTVLSRCLQFNLKHLNPPQISQQLIHILDQEDISYEVNAIQALANAAAGSMRDALSLLDQAITYCEENVTQSQVEVLLGSVNPAHILNILTALVAEDPQATMDSIAEFAQYSDDYDQALAELLNLLHQICTLQLVPEYTNENLANYQDVSQLAKKMSAEDAQLYYQIGLIGRRDLKHAPSARSGFEMILLRMLAFRPQIPTAAAVNSSAQAKDAKTSSVGSGNNNWANIVEQLQLTGVCHLLASSCSLKSINSENIELILSPEQSPLLTPSLERKLTQALQNHFKGPIKVRIEITQTDLESPVQKDLRESAEKQQTAQQAIVDDPNVKMMLKNFDGKIATIKNN